jgi:ABC-type transport system substrate-binding protein
MYYWNLEEVLAPNDTTVIIRRTDPSTPDWFTVYYPEHLLGALDPEEIWTWDFWNDPVGNGAYRYSRHVPQTLWVAEANDDYYAARPAIDRVQVKLGGGSSIVELLAGNVDVVTDFDRATLPSLDGEQDFRVYYEMPPHKITFEAIWWNHTHPFLASPDVRRALTHAIDRRELRQLQRVPEFVPIADVPFTTRQLLREEVPAPMTHAPEKARALLAEAGWRDLDGDGVRERGGVKASFTALAGPGSDNAAVYVQAALRGIGVEMEIQIIPNPPRGEIQSGEFEAAFDRFLPWRPTWQEETGYVNEHTKRLLAAAEANAVPGVVDEYYRQTWADFSRDVPLTLLGQQVWTMVAHRRVQGLATPLRVNPFYHARELWIEER